MTRALLFSSTTSAVFTSSKNAARPSGLLMSRQTPRLLRFISLKYMARCQDWRCKSWCGPTQTNARVAGRVAHSTLMLSAPRSARNRPATGPAQFVVTSMMRIPSSGARPPVLAGTAAAAGDVVVAGDGSGVGSGIDPECSPTDGAGPRRRDGVDERL